jgi:hypothetical protein
MFQGIAVVVLFSVFLGLYLYNRHRRRLHPRSGIQSKTRRIPNPLPSLSFPSPPSDPYAHPLPELEIDDQVTPRASHFLFKRGAMDRVASEEWEVPYDKPKAVIASGNVDNGQERASRFTEESAWNLLSGPEDAADPLSHDRP